MARKVAGDVTEFAQPRAYGAPSEARSPESSAARGSAVSKKRALGGKAFWLPYAPLGALSIRRRCARRESALHRPRQGAPWKSAECRSPSRRLVHGDASGGRASRPPPRRQARFRWIQPNGNPQKERNAGGVRCRLVGPGVIPTQPTRGGVPSPVAVRPHAGGHPAPLPAVARWVAEALQWAAAFTAWLRMLLSVTSWSRVTTQHAVAFLRIPACGWTRRQPSGLSSVVRR